MLDEPAIRVMMMPRETNGQGTIFGGVLLSYIDQAGAVAAQRRSSYRVVTVALEKVEFKQAVLVGDVVSFYSNLVKTGRTSLTVDVNVVAERFHSGVSRKVDVTQATLVFVSIDEQGRPVGHGVESP
jgi:acyl-CoA thioesterase YciA